MFVFSATAAYESSITALTNVSMKCEDDDFDGKSNFDHLSTDIDSIDKRLTNLLHENLVTADIKGKPWPHCCCFLYIKTIFMHFSASKLAQLERHLRFFSEYF